MGKVQKVWVQISYAIIKTLKNRKNTILYTSHLYVS
jgi:hypothetical protein